MRRWLAILAVAAALGLPVGAMPETIEQDVTPLEQGEQQVEPLAPEGEQRVEAVDAATAQNIQENATRSRAGRAADAAAKVVVGVFAAAVAIGATVAALLFL